MSEALLRDFEYPPGRPRASGSFITVNRAVGEVSDRGSVLVINKIDIESGQRGERKPTTMTPGTDGFFGLGISSERSFLYTATGGRFTLGIDTESSDGLRTVGRLDWGGVNKDQTDGDFEWIKTNASWTIGIESIGIRGGSIVGDNLLQATIDPGLGAIYAPFSVASDFYAQAQEAKPVKNADRARWKLPCDQKLKFELKLEDGRGFGVPPDLLRIKEGDICYGAVYAWANHSTPDNSGKIRLGTPFLDEWYTTRGEPGPNGKLIGGLIGSLVPLMLIFLVVVHARNTYTIPAWLDRQYRAMYDWEQAARAQAAMRAGMAPQPLPPMPFGAPDDAPNARHYARPVHAPAGVATWTAGHAASHRSGNDGYASANAASASRNDWHAAADAAAAPPSGDRHAATNAPGTLAPSDDGCATAHATTHATWAAANAGGAAHATDDDRRRPSPGPTNADGHPSHNATRPRAAARSRSSRPPTHRPSANSCASAYAVAYASAATRPSTDATAHAGAGAIPGRVWGHAARA
ncbi:hypothetical protein A1Q2_00775 [Trichosporon asahii var. asahii CBS 8904]|uniref:Peptidase A1 domain-containing protein n=1 Tax=Trichosporon asahii var. asahii (strain CBS 8904) TaxID=1220162 RepID=K1WVP9_TRIAC|nr:hypothetical protein A1Q2_00775 [Trichosporon asahii var. asahii CBS 8904]